MKKQVLALLVCASSAALCANAALGDVDSSYSPQLPAPCDGPIAPLEDGGAYVALRGAASVTHTFSIAGVARIDSRGQPIASWGASGSTTIFTTSPWPDLVQLLRGADGSIYALDAAGITRIDRNGNLDRGYGDNGRVALVVDGSLLSAALQPDGKVVVFGLRQGPPTFTRLDTNGALDLSFGTAGSVEVRVPLPVQPYGWAVRDDRVVEIGMRRGPQLTPTLFVVSPLLGTTTETGRIVPQGAASWFSPAVKAEPTGAVVFASNGDLERFTPEGSRDASFGTGGRTPLPATIGMALWRDVDGGWIAFTKGFFNIGFSIINDDFVRASRYTATGQPDASFPTRRLGFIIHVDRAPDGNVLACLGRSLVDSALAKLSGDGVRAEVTLSEYYHPVLDHYFLTSTPAEIAGLDAYPFGWVRTGQSFGAWSPGNLPGAAHVCRFYGDPVIGPNSHFYTGEDFECEGLIRLDAATPRGIPAWHLEAKPFDIAIPSGGACPANLQPVYRAFNGPAARTSGPNHRYTTDPAVYAAMLAKGWLAEGVHFCAPPRLND